MISADVKKDATPITSEADAIKASGVKNAFDNFWKNIIVFAFFIAFPPE